VTRSLEVELTSLKIWSS